MSDYLHNLVARHLNLVEVVQPRLASRYEPPSILSPLGAENSVGPGELETHAEAGPKFSESRFVSRITDDTDGSDSLSPRAVPEHRMALEPSTGNKFSPEPPETLAHTSESDTKHGDDFEQKMDGHSLHVKEVRAHTGDELVTVTATPEKLPGSPVVTPIRASSSTPAEEPLASSEQTIRAEVDRPEKKIESSLEQPALQQTPERSDDSVTAQITDRQKLSPAHVRREIEMVVERREAPQQSDVPYQSDAQTSTIPDPLTRHQTALSRSVEHETPVRESAPSPRRVESPSQNMSLAGREKMDERYVERVLVERPVPVESRRILKPPEIDAERVKPARARAPGGVVAQPRVIRYSEPKATAMAEVRQGEEPVPTINVTIGRIEVRAVAPDPSARERRQSATQPRMSLSDYLQRRAGGGGR